MWAFLNHVSHKVSSKAGISGIAEIRSESEDDIRLSPGSNGSDRASPSSSEDSLELELDWESVDDSDSSLDSPLHYDHDPIPFIEMFENVIGQDKLAAVESALLKHAPEYISDFYQIVSDYTALCANADEPQRADRLLIIKQRIEHYFSQHDTAFNWHSEASAVPEDEILRKNQSILVVEYFKAYVYKNFHIDNGQLKLKISDSFERYQSKAQQLLSKIAQPEFNFCPANNLLCELESDDELALIQRVQGAQAGSMPCQSDVGKVYLSFLAGTLSQANPPAFEAPEGLTQENIVAYLKASNASGDMTALAAFNNFLCNYFGAVGAIYQRDADGASQITPAQTARLDLIESICIEVAGDAKITNYIEAVRSIQTEGRDNKAVIADFKAIKAQATAYIVEDFSLIAQPKPERIKTLRGYQQHSREEARATEHRLDAFLDEGYMQASNEAAAVAAPKMMRRRF